MVTCDHLSQGGSQDADWELAGAKKLVVHKIPVDRVRPIVERAIRERSDWSHLDEEMWGGPGGGIYTLAEELAVNWGSTREATAKIIRNVLRGWIGYVAKKVPDGDKKHATTKQMNIMESLGIQYETPLSADDAWKLLRTVSRRPYTHMDFKLADKILSGLDLNHLWHTELADVYWPPPKTPRDRKKEYKAMVNRKKRAERHWSSLTPLQQATSILNEEV